MNGHENPAATMRRAAALMRERAGGCEQRSWHWNAPGTKRYPQFVRSDGNVALIAETFIDPAHRPYETEHIASWHPLVAAAVADWLDARAHAEEGTTAASVSHPLKVALAYLGEAS